MSGKTKREKIENRIKKLISDKLGKREALVTGLKYYKSSFPNKNDYGLSQAGIVPNSTVERIQLYEECGYKGKTTEKPKTIGGEFTRLVGEIADEMLWREEAKVTGKKYIGHFCWAGSGKQLAELPVGSVVEQMKENSCKVHPVPPKDKEIKAWKGEIKALLSMLKKHPEFQKLTYVFEYVVPKVIKGAASDDYYFGIRADVVVLGASKTLVLEFKKRTSENEIYYVNQVHSYQKSIDKLHIENGAVPVKSAVILLDESASNYRKSVKGTDCYSADLLYDALENTFGYSTKAHPNPEKWIASKWKEKA